MTLEITTKNETDAAVVPKVTQSKVMLLAVYREDGQLKIGPISTGPEPEGPGPETAYEFAKEYLSKMDLLQNLGALKMALGSLYSFFEMGLYRKKYDSFEKFCRDIFDVYSTPEEIAAKYRAKETTTGTTMKTNTLDCSKT
jgi:hypothetical protein